MAVAPHEAEEAAHGADAATHGADAAAHGVEHAATFPPFDPTLFASQLVWFALTFGALYFILSRLVLPKVQDVLDRRASTLKSDLDAAHRESEAAERARLEMERVAAEARANARKVVEDMRARAQAELSAEQEKVDAKHAAEIAAAEARIAAKRDEALKQVDALSKDLARDIVARLTGAGAAEPRKARA
ncbi:MAG: F0F1 ATP synthase subunit B' [Hyphomonadaceae bacterium]